MRPHNFQIEKLIPQALLVLGIAYTCLALYSIQAGVVQPGLDESWMYGLNALAQSSYAFGKDVVFTYGPLGFLSHPRAIGANLKWAALFSAALQLILGLALLPFVRDRRTRYGVPLFLAGLLGVSALGLWEEYYHRLILGLCLLGALKTTRLSYVLCVVAGSLTAMLFLVKLSTGITAVFMLLIWSVMAFVLLQRRIAIYRIAALGIPLVLMLGIAIVTLFRGMGNFKDWVSFAYEIAAGYGSAMSVTGPMIEACAGIAILLVFIACLVLLDGAMRLPLLLFLIPAILACKHGFVGHPMMATGYFTFAAGIASLLFLYAENKREILFALSLFLITASVVVLKGTLSVSSPELSFARAEKLLTLRTGLDDLGSAWNWRQLTRDLEKQAERQLGEQVLPPRWQRELKQSPNGADVFPWELTYLPANGVQWRPTLVMQQYAAYTAKLDQAVARRLRSPDAPGALLIQMVGLFQRNPVLDSPATFQEVFRHYEMKSVDPERNLMLLSRRATQAPDANWKTLSESREVVGQWIEVPKQNGKLFARIQMRRNLIGEIRRYAWKTPTVTITLHHASGRENEFRMLPETAENGMFLNYPPGTIEELQDVFLRSARDEVTQFRISGPGTGAFRPTFQLQWVTDNESVSEQRSFDKRAAPRVVSVSPAIVHGQTTNLQIVASSQNGFRGIPFIQTIVNTTVNGQGACYFSYESKRNILWLIDDSGSKDAGHGTPESPDFLENSRCIINLRETYVEQQREGITLHVELGMKQGSPARQTVYAAAIDETIAPTHWVPFAKWDVESQSVKVQPWQIPESAPQLSVVASAGGQKSEYTLNMLVHDWNGIEDIASADLIVNDLQTTRAGCHVRYDRKANTLLLTDDSGEGSSGVVQLGKASGKIANSYCTIHSDRITIVEKARDLAISIPVSLSPLMSDKNLVFGTAEDREGWRQNWRMCAVLPKR